MRASTPSANAWRWCASVACVALVDIGPPVGGETRRAACRAACRANIHGPVRPSRGAGPVGRGGRGVARRAPTAQRPAMSPRTVAVVDYDPAWPARFAELAARAAAALALAPAVPARVEHVGSTA